MNAKVEILNITPKLAAEWLANRWPEQRKVRNNHVERIAKDMTDGNFILGPDAIVRVKGKLANGQHRLEAVVMSGRAQQFIVLISDDDELYKVIDCGMRRTVSDAIANFEFHSALPSIARWLFAYEKKSVSQSFRGGGPSQIDMINYCEEHKDQLTEAARFVNPIYSETKLLPLSIGGALYVIASRAGHVDSVKQFLTAVYLEGGNNSAGDLRNRLIGNKGSKAKLPAPYVFGITLKAFRSFNLNIRAGTLKWVEGEALPEID